MERLRKVGPEAGWAGLVAYVVLYDAIAISLKKPTLSSCFASYLSRNPYKVLLLATWCGLTGHLFWSLAEEQARRYEIMIPIWALKKMNGWTERDCAGRPAVAVLIEGDGV